jgi:predicted MFS family arabinose efflux permease
MSGAPVHETEGRIATYRSPELRIIFGISLIAVLGVSSLAPALPWIARALDVSVGQVGLLITVFALPGVFLTPVLGVMADRIGRRRVLVPGLLLFTAAGAACFFVRSFPVLLVLRFLQGAGAAPIGSLNVTLIGDLYSGRQRIAAMGYNASVLSVGTAVYPAIGGALATLAWYAPFALPLAALPVAALVAFHLDISEPVDRRPFAEYLGDVWREVRSRQVVVLLVATTVIFTLLFGAYVTFLPFLMVERFDAAPYAIGLMMASFSVVTALTSASLGRISRRVPERALVRVGLVAFAVGLAITPTVSTFWAMALPAVVLGFAFATTIPVVQTILAGLAPAERRAAFMSLNGMVLRLGQTLGPVLSAAVYAALGLDAVFLSGAGLALAMAALMAWAVRTRVPVG